jgi:hypothetical protein
MCCDAPIIKKIFFAAIARKDVATIMNNAEENVFFADALLKNIQN